MTIPRLIKSIGRSPLRLALLLIPLVFACFAIAQSAQAAEPNERHLIGNMAEEDDAVAKLGAATENAAAGQSTPRQIGHNKWVIPIDFTTPLQCAGGNVIVHANLVVTFKNVPDVGVVRHELKLEEFRGTATNGTRKLEAHPKDVKFLPYVKVDSKNGGPSFGFVFIVTGPGFQGGGVALEL